METICWFSNVIAYLILSLKWFSQNYLFFGLIPLLIILQLKYIMSGIYQMKIILSVHSEPDRPTMKLLNFWCHWTHLFLSVFEFFLRRLPVSLSKGISFWSQAFHYIWVTFWFPSSNCLSFSLPFCMMPFLWYHFILVMILASYLSFISLSLVLLYA